MNINFIIGLAAVICFLLSVPALASEEKAIQDNSFLIEEAYNQEKGVVQHIGTFQVLPKSGDWTYTFTQEWPIVSQRHQLSYTVPVQKSSGQIGFGDVAFSYRYQLVGNGETRVAFAPRLSILVPTGDSRRSLGNGSVGMQGNLPFSLVLMEHLVAHSNLGGTIFPDARNEFGDHALTRGFNAGQSLIWLIHPVFNIMAEIAWTSMEAVESPSQRKREDSLFLSPGLRGAANFSSGLQIVPGIAVPIGLGPSHGEIGVFAYLSFEHPFMRER